MHLPDGLAGLTSMPGAFLENNFCSCVSSAGANPSAIPTGILNSSIISERVMGNISNTLLGRDLLWAAQDNVSKYCKSNTLQP